MVRFQQGCASPLARNMVRTRFLHEECFFEWTLQKKQHICFPFFYVQGEWYFLSWVQQLFRCQLAFSCRARYETDPMDLLILCCCSFDILLSPCICVAPDRHFYSTQFPTRNNGRWTETLDCYQRVTWLINELRQNIVPFCFPSNFTKMGFCPKNRDNFFSQKRFLSQTFFPKEDFCHKNN